MNYRRSYNRKRDQRTQPKRLRDSEKSWSLQCRAGAHSRASHFHARLNKTHPMQKRHRRPTTTGGQPSLLTNRTAAPRKLDKGRGRSKLCRGSLDEEPTPRGTAPPPHNQRRAIRHELQGGIFKKSTAPKRRYRPIQRSWVFTRRSWLNRALPHRRLQQGNDVHGRRRRGPNGQGFPPAIALCPSTQGSGHRCSNICPAVTACGSPEPRRRHGRGSQPAPESLVRPPTSRTPTVRGRRPGIPPLQTDNLRESKGQRREATARQPRRRLATTTSTTEARHEESKPNLRKRPPSAPAAVGASRSETETARRGSGPCLGPHTQRPKEPPPPHQAASTSSPHKRCVAACLASRRAGHQPRRRRLHQTDRAEAAPPPPRSLRGGTTAAITQRDGWYSVSLLVIVLLQLNPPYILDMELGLAVEVRDEDGSNKMARGRLTNVGHFHEEVLDAPEHFIKIIF
nr:uncharacterized protein LOC127315390 [Lolium perenne]